METEFSSQRAKAPLWWSPLAPATVTVLLAIWTFVIAPTTSYGDIWTLVPAIVAFPFALIWHGLVAVLNPLQRGRTILVATFNLAVLALACVYSLMLISRDSL